MIHTSIFRWLTLVPLLFGISNYGAADDWKLQPLKYNNPDLAVDLGVGLWAWPMPMDYDNDGDLDLLVGCPDKPSNGVYFFENPTQDASVKTPTFLPGVRLGSATHNMQVSYVDGQPRILRNGHEYPRDPATGEFNFAKPKRIFPKDNIHENRVRGNMWRYVDYDGDGDHDIVVGAGDWTEYVWDNAYDSSGRWRNGPLHGYVYWIENQGNDDSPKYSDQPTKIHAAGGAIDVYGWPSPNFADFDNDGDLDLLCGEFLDGFTYFENVGTRNEPVYGAGQRLQDENSAPLVMHLQMITPTAFDWDADGDLDLIVGDEDGRVALVENTGKFQGSAPVFSAPQYFQQQADTLKFGALATPYVYDWDGDGDEDILCGNTAGNIALFENLGDADNGLPKWSAPQLLRSQSAAGGEEKEFRILAGESGSIQGPCEAKWGYTTLSVADWDKNGEPDILYNSILSKIGLLKNQSGKLIDVAFDSGQQETPPAWYWWQTKSSDALSQWRTTPVAIDFDDDKELDLVMLDQEGYLTLRSAGGPAERIFVDEDNQPLQLNPRSCGSSGRVKLAVVDWDGDGRKDILTNSENATWYRNCETRDGKIVLKSIGNLAKRNVAGHTSSPAVCDFNKDEKPDLIVGAENGRLYFIAHDDCVDYAADKLTAAPAKESAAPKFLSWESDTLINDNAPYKECHASTICETNRGLVAAWFGGTKEKHKDVGIWTSYHDGTKWSRATEVANGVQHDGLRYPCWNPVLFQPPGDAPTLLFFKVGPTPSTWWGEMMVSYDGGRTFVERKRLPEGIDGPVRCQPILLADGKTLLSGSSTEYDGWTVHFESIGLSNGQPAGTWSRVGPINSAKEFNAIQPTFLTHSDGRIQVLCRTKESVITTSFSKDNGKTWSKMEAIDLPNPNSGIDAIDLADGRKLLIYNPLGSGENGWGRRAILSLAVSKDGIHWKKFADIEREASGEFSYPSMIQAADGKVHITYTWMRKKIKHVVLDSAEIPAP
ncbi:FG-GAP repeat protein [Roseimaritima multifibrata]|uniref:FG-GAP repeat protein n=1 Tax=Roseimaritima multifibrata TaxID=1930274 RepID=A0A517MHJ2_9BACT|nr:exo-alpha-sialidase [Roseimaritima multifibrata]QDS94354.1 FG-GAP repeat protein [Roseimaritima multifibrata]